MHKVCRNASQAGKRFFDKFNISSCVKIIMLKNFIAMVSLLFLMTTHSFADEFSGNIKGIYVNKSGQVLVSLLNLNSAPICANGVWSFSFTLSEQGAKEWIAMLLMARASNAIIKVGYTASATGPCNAAYFYILD